MLAFGCFGSLITDFPQFSAVGNNQPEIKDYQA
jgi:hypothetical protein